jgi:type II secretory pathway component PulF
VKFVYRWTAISAGGQRIAGCVTADDSADARRQMRAQGLKPIQVEPDPIRTLKAWIHPQQLSVRSLAEAFGFLAESSELELPLADVLAIAERSASDERLKQHLAAWRAFLAQGASFSDAIERAGGMPVFAIQLLRTAEESGAPGALAEAFRSLGDHYRVHGEFSRRTRKAIVQPAFTAVIVFAVVVFVVTVLVPRLRPLFALFKDLPWLARAVFGVADMVSEHSVLSGVVFLGAVVIAWNRRTTLIGALPGVQTLLAAVGGFQICTALGLLLRSGFPAARALTIVGAGLEGQLGKRVAHAATRVSHGTPLCTALAGVGLKAEVLEMIRRREQIGQLAEGIARAGAFYRRFVEERFDVLANNIGLALTLAAAGLLIVVALGIFMPLYAGLGSLSMGGP